MEEVRGEYEAQALKDLVEIAVALKKSGVLDLLKVLSEKSDELLTLLADDITVYRAVGLADAALTGLYKSEPDDIIGSKKVIEDLTRCTIKSLSKAGSEGVKPVGLTGLIGALRDRDVQVGLGLLIQIARGLGSCYRESG